ncbi:MAG: hypothetical protein MUC72_07650 [Acidobacteria bacterium]|jgi:hypothetical protein|nr:hypothetical protein [Acidobacteriota bacterium]
MSKKTIFLFLGLGLAASLFADLGLSFSLLSSQSLTVFTSQEIWNKEPQPSFRDTLLVLSSFQPNRQEFLVFGNIISGKGVPIENGLWDTRKTTLGMGFGKVLTIPFSLQKHAVAMALDFTAGPFFYLFLSNHYTHVGGQYKKEVEESSILNRVQYGLYATVRLRLQEFKKYLRSVDASLGLHFFMPFSNHELNDDPKARYHLFKTFLCAGVSF